MTIRRRSTRVSLLAAVCAGLGPAGCGDDKDDGDDGTPVDASPAADASPDPDAAPTAATVFAVAGDFMTTGVASTITVPALQLTRNAVDGVASPDPVVRQFGDRLFIVNRFQQDNVTVLDAGDLSLVAQVSTGASSNPQDLAAVGDTLFVAALGSSGILVVDLTRPDDGVVATIDLSELDEDGRPDCNTIAAVGDRLVAICGVLDNFTPRGPGRIALIDPALRSVVARGTMTERNPIGLAQPAGAGGQSLLVSTLPDFTAPAGGGCVERIAVAGDGGSVESECLVDNSELGGYATALAWDPAGERVWMAITAAFGPPRRSELVSIAESGEDLERAPLGEVIPMDLARCPTGHLAVSDATRGVRVFAPGVEEELTTDALNIGLPPVQNGLTCY